MRLARFVAAAVAGLGMLGVAAPPGTADEPVPGLPAVSAHEFTVAQGKLAAAVQCDPGA
jgi:hypothetical protein